MRAKTLEHRGTMVGVVLAGVVLLAAVVAGGSLLPPGPVQRVNVAADGGFANQEGSLGLACSADGRYVAFGLFGEQHHRGRHQRAL